MNTIIVARCWMHCRLKGNRARRMPSIGVRAGIRGEPIADLPH
jgi:hypothetical protein